MAQKVSTSNFAFIIRTSLSKFAALNDRARAVRMLVSLGESAFALRQWGDLAQVGHALAESPLPAHRAIGSYYTGLAANPFGKGDRERALRAFERTAEDAPPIFQARALVSQGALAANIEDRKIEAWFYNEALDRARRDDCQDVQTIIQASRMIAVLHSLEGDHHRAFDELEQLWPMVRAIASSDPVTYLRWLNSLAVELG